LRGVPTGACRRFRAAQLSHLQERKEFQTLPLGSTNLRGPLKWRQPIPHRYREFWLAPLGQPTKPRSNSATEPRDHCQLPTPNIHNCSRQFNPTPNLSPGQPDKLRTTVKPSIIGDKSIPACLGQCHGNRRNLSLGPTELPPRNASFCNSQTLQYVTANVLPWGSGLRLT